MRNNCLTKAVIRIWEIAIAQMIKEDNTIYGPMSFKEYIKSNELPKRQTASSISIDSYEKLPNILKSEDIMVLRLGGLKETRFILVKVKGKLNEFFLHDHEVFPINKAVDFRPVTPKKTLMGYKIMPILSETSLVNLALTSGVLGEALGFDEKQVPGAPATGRSTFTFTLRPHSKINQVFEHYNGQVEIDALFVEKREGIDTLFVIEAKSDIKQKSLAKHKLLYPILSISQKLSANIQIVPVYLKTYQEGDVFYFHVLECNIPDPRKSLVSIDKITPKKHNFFKLML